MHGKFITKKELSSLDGERWINNVVCILSLILIFLFYILFDINMLIP